MKNTLDTTRGPDCDQKLSPDVTNGLKRELLRMATTAPEHVRRVVRDTIRRHAELFVEGEA